MLYDSTDLSIECRFAILDAAMQDIQEVYNRIQDKKKERKRLKGMFKDGIDASTPLREVKEQFETIRAKRKRMETEIKEAYSKELQELEAIEMDIKSDQLLMDDIALTKAMKGEPVVFKDAYDAEYEPVLKVKYQKVR